MKFIIFIFGFILILYNAAFAGTIEGVVKYDGPVPKARFIHMDADPVCYTVNKGNIHQPALVIGKGNTLGNVFVYVKSGLPQISYSPPAKEAVITQAGCNYNPHVIGVMAGQKVKFLNPDGTLHNVHAMCRINREFNIAMPDFRKEMEVTFGKPEFMFPIRCDVHPWMLAWMAVMSHPFFAVTGPDGRFEINNLPPGTYQLEAWHEKLGVKDTKVTVTNSAPSKTDFTFSKN